MPFQQLGFFLIYMWEYFICFWQGSWNFCAKNSWPYFPICILLFSHGSLGVSQLRGVWLLVQTRSSTDLISVQITLFHIIRSFQNHMSAGIICEASSEPGRFPRRSPGRFFSKGLDRGHSVEPTDAQASWKVKTPHIRKEILYTQPCLVLLSDFYQHKVHRRILREMTP